MIASHASLRSDFYNPVPKLRLGTCRSETPFRGQRVPGKQSFTARRPQTEFGDAKKAARLCSVGVPETDCVSRGKRLASRVPLPHRAPESVTGGSATAYDDPRA